MDDEFSLVQFEALVKARAYDAAVHALTRLFEILRTRRGELPGIVFADADPARSVDQHASETIERIVHAVSALFCDSDFLPDDAQMYAMLNGQRWFNMLFSVSSFGNPDHLVEALDAQTNAARDVATLNAIGRKQIIACSLDSSHQINFPMVVRASHALAIDVGASIIGSPVVISAAAHAKREAMIESLPVLLDSTASLDALPINALCGAYMHCSYAASPQRHRVKASINRLIRQTLRELGVLEDETRVNAMPARSAHESRKPVMIVVPETFTGGHSVYRTHSSTLVAARRYFETIALGLREKVDAVGRAVFDRFIALENPADLVGIVRQVQQCAREYAADVLYMPGVGLSVHAIFLANVRVAPLQIAAFGHPATTHSDQIDCMSAEEDFVVDPSRFSEQILWLPRDGQPFVPSGLLKPIAPTIPVPDEYVNVAVMASPMKLNPDFLQACQRVVDTAAVPVRFHFMTSVRESLTLAYVRKLIHAALPHENARVYGAMDYMTYMRMLNASDMFVSSFPFGYMNGIADALTVGLPGVNLRGVEPFERFDAALFARARLPDWLTTDSVDAWVRAAVKLAEQRRTRETLRARLLREKAVERLYAGKPEAFGKRVLKLLNERRGRHCQSAADADG